MVQTMVLGNHKGKLPQIGNHRGKLPQTAAQTAAAAAAASQADYANFSWRRRRPRLRRHQILTRGMACLY
jgi:hypothetical protein